MSWAVFPPPVATELAGAEESPEQMMGFNVIYPVESIFHLLSSGYIIFGQLRQVAKEQFKPILCLIHTLIWG